MSRPPAPPRRRDPVVKSLRYLSGGGPHRTGPTRADLKRELRQRILRDEVPERSTG